METIGVCRPYRFVSTAKMGIIFEIAKKNRIFFEGGRRETNLNI